MKKNIKIDLSAILTGMAFSYLLAVPTVLTAVAVNNLELSEVNSNVDTAFLVEVSIIGALVNMIGGFVSARLSKQDKILNGTVVGSVWLILNIASIVGLPPHPQWFNVLSLITAVPLANLGARLTRRGDVTPVTASQETMEAPVGVWRRASALIVDKCALGPFWSTLHIYKLGIPIEMFFWLVVSSLYFVLFESSASRATPGKSLLKIYVANANGTRPSALRIGVRYLVYLSIAIPLLITELTPAFHRFYDTWNQLKETHDEQAIRAYVLSSQAMQPIALTLSAVAFYIFAGLIFFALPMIFSKRKAGVHDFLTKTGVFRTVVVQPDIHPDQTAAENGDPAKQYNLAVAYANGQGVKQNTLEASKWYRKAADGGHLLAQSTIGKMYYLGSGVNKDFVEAYFWWKIAAMQDPLYRGSMADAARNLTAEQIAAVDRRVEEWTPGGIQLKCDGLSKAG